MVHEVVDGAARLGGLQTFIGRHAVSEGIDNTNLKDKGKLSVLGVTGEQRGRFWSSLFWVLSLSSNKCHISSVCWFSSLIGAAAIPYLRLDTIQAAAPKHVAPPQLHLSVIDLIQVLHLLQLLFGDLLLLRAVTGRLEELQPTGGDAGHQLRGG